MASFMEMVLSWRAGNPTAAWLTAAAGAYTLYRGAGIHKKPLVVLTKHAITTLTAMVVAPLANLLVLGPKPPVDPSSISPEWLTWLLREKKLLTSEQNVTSVSVTEFEAGKTGRSGRVKLTYNTESIGAPLSVVVKMSRVDFRGRFLNLVLFLSREAHFFAQLADESPMSIPSCLYTKVSWFSNAFIIVMSDVAPSHELTNSDEVKAAFSATPFDQSTSVSIEKIESVVDMVSRMHAKYLGDTSLYRKKWILGAEAYRTKGRDVTEYGLTWLFILNTWKKTKQNVVEGKWLGTPWSKKMLNILDETFDFVKNANFGESISKHLWPTTLTHGDYHGSNLLIKEEESGKDKSPLEAVALDFQIMAINEPGADIGKLLLICLSPEDRRKHEKRLVRQNYDALVAAGLDSDTMPFELFFMRYQYNGAFAWSLIVGVLDTLFADGKDDEYLVPLIYTRLAAFCDDHGSPVDINAKSTEWRERLLKQK